MATEKQNEFYQIDDDKTVLASGADWMRKVSLEIPLWALTEIDKEARRKGISRQALMNTWLIDKLDNLKSEIVV